ncbi:MAG TPA: hypothetical protein VKT73_06340 [Xanthobacteraceae bacterium]|nr:hypothetical protein [Xanthobacteraceae bacterium]
MAVIILRCHKTHTDILPGIEISEADFQSIPPAARPVKCPVCGEEHSWLPYAARVAEALARAGKGPSVGSSRDRDVEPVADNGELSDVES